MRITYDPQVDALYIKLIDGHHEVLTKMVNADVALDYSDDDQLVGIEVLNAREVLNNGGPISLSVENVPVSSSWTRPASRPAADTNT